MDIKSVLAVAFGFVVLVMVSAEPCGECNCVSGTMDCSGRGIQNLESISPDANITEMWLEQNSLVNISATAFASSDYLQRLDLSNNYITLIDQDAFADLLNLKYLDLSNNLVARLPDLVFRNLFSLERLILHHNQISDLTFLHHIKNCSLTTLTLSENSLSSIPSKALHRCALVRQLNLAGNKLVGIAPDAFAGLELLERLDLSLNNLPNLPQEVFQPLSALRILDIASNEITSLPDGIFSSLGSVVAIDVSYNWLDHVPAWTFSRCLSLRRLTLRDNLIESVDANAFVRLPARPPLRTPSSIHSSCANISSRNSNIELIHLDLSNNHLRGMNPAVLIAFPELEELKVGGNLITTFGPELVCAAATIGEDGSGLLLGDTGLACVCGPLKEALVLSRQIAPKFQQVCLHTKKPWNVLDGLQCSTKSSKKEERVTSGEVETVTGAASGVTTGVKVRALAPTTAASSPLAASTPEDSSSSTVQAAVIAPILAIAFLMSLAAMAVSVFRVFRRARYDVPEAEEGLNMTQYRHSTQHTHDTLLNSINNITRL